MGSGILLLELLKLLELLEKLKNSLVDIPALGLGLLDELDKSLTDSGTSFDDRAALELELLEELDAAGNAFGNWAALEL
jgi:hypothetical protein